MTFCPNILGIGIFVRGVRESLKKTPAKKAKKDDEKASKAKKSDEE